MAIYITSLLNLSSDIIFNRRYTQNCHMYSPYPLFPFLPSVCIHNGRGRTAKNRKGLGAFITRLTSGGCEVDMGEGQLPNQHTGLTVWMLYYSFGIQTSAKLRILIGKKLTFKFSMYVFEYQFPPCPTWWILSGLPHFFAGLVLLCTIVNANICKVTTGEAWEQGYNLLVQNTAQVSQTFGVTG